MQACSCNLQFPYETVVHINLDVVFVAIMHLAMLDRKRGVFVNVLLLLFCVLNSLSFFLGLFLLIISFSAQIRFYESSVLYDSFFYLVAFFIQLSLKLIPDFTINSFFFQFVPNLPDS